MQDVTKGWVSGFIGVAIFAGSLPATRLAVLEFDPVFLTAIRATIPAVLGIFVLFFLKQPMPTKKELTSLAVVALGVVVGFPLLSAMALQYVTSAHAIVFLGILPLITAVFATLRGDKNPPILFWLFALGGSLCVAGYAALTSGHASISGGLYMLGAVLTCGLGYAEGGRLSRKLGGWQVISWALILSLPIMLPIAVFVWPNNLNSVSVTAWLSLFYVALFSMFIGFIFWYKGLAIGGIASVGQLQLLQPFMGLMLASLLLHETVSIGMIISTLGAVLCVMGAKKFAV